MLKELFALNRNKYGTYPCNDYLNNALMALLNDENPHRTSVAFAISEICWCIFKADGKFHDDVAKRLAETGLCPFERY